MGSMNYFGQVIQEILQNNYLKTNFENLKIRDFSQLFKISEGRNFPLKNALFSER